MGRRTGEIIPQTVSDKNPAFDSIRYVVLNHVKWDSFTCGKVSVTTGVMDYEDSLAARSAGFNPVVDVR
jgi:hypothetical protein